MSEHDNLQDADGDKINITSTKTKIKEDVSSLSEVVKEIETETKSTRDATLVRKKENFKEESSEEEVSEKAEDKEEKSLDDGNQKKTDKSEAEIDFKRIESEENFESLSLEDLVNKFESLLENENSQNVRNSINKIKNNFKASFAILIAEKKDTFLTEGGNIIDFNFTSPLKKKYNDLSKAFRERQQSFQKNKTQQLNQNLEIRLQIIEEIKGLINLEGDINSSYNNFKNLQERWRNTGQIPSSENNNTWNNYRHHVEIFYGFLHLNRDLRDLDYKHNLEQKQKIIKSTEELATETDLNRAFRELQALHKIWKEELGPVAKEFKDELWERFSTATKVINDKRQDYYGQLEETFNENLVIKNDIINKIKEISEKTTLVHKEWQANIKEIEALRDAFFKAGKVPSSQNEKTWSAFKNAVRVFNKSKNSYYKTLKKDQSENYRKKLELVGIAEQNKDSLDLEITLILMKNIQNRWKSIGHIPRKDSDKLWKRFKDACNLFFERYHEQKNNGSEEEIKSFEEKTSLLETLNSFLPSDDKDTNLESLNQFSSRWKKIGNVTKSKRFIDDKFYKTLDGLYSKIGLDKLALENLKYSLKLEVISKDSRLFNNEVIFLRKKIDEIKSEINQLENNLQFFSNVNDENPLVKEVHKNIAKCKEILKVWQFKYSKIKKLIN